MKRSSPIRRTPLPPSSKPLKRSAMKRTTKPIPAHSEKGEQYETDFRNAKYLVRERSAGLCEFERISGVLFRRCTERGVHVHHRKPRARGGSNNLENLVLLCQPCHNWVHGYPIEANRLGLLLHTNEPEEIT